MNYPMQLNAVLLTGAVLFGAYHYGLLESVIALAILGSVVAMFWRRVFG